MLDKLLQFDFIGLTFREEKVRNVLKRQDDRNVDIFGKEY